MTSKRIEFSIETTKGCPVTSSITIGPDGSAVGTISRGVEDVNWTYREVTFEEEKEGDDPGTAET